MSSSDEDDYRPAHAGKRVTIADAEATEMEATELDSLLPDCVGEAEDTGDVSIDEVGPTNTSSIRTYPPNRTITTYSTNRSYAVNRDEYVLPSAKLTAVERLTANWRPKKCGLNNVGNTCFMNAGLQCLLCTTELTHFFVRGFYKQDLNLDNPLGCKGKVAESFKLLVDQTHSHTETWAPQKNHWGVATHAVEPAHFKRAIGQFNAMFSGYDQHDSQELLGAALDGIHEDLNRVKQKPYVENVVGDGKNDTAVAQEAWDRYKMRNDSFIVDTFQGQTRSRLTCPECKNMSVSFEPSMYLSVAFKQVVPPSSLRVVVKFQSPASVRPDDQVPFDELPQGFHFDCDVKVFLTEPADTFGSLVKRFEDRTSGRRFVAVTFVQQYSGAAAFSGFCLPSENVPTERKNANHYVLLEVPEFAANGWIEWDGLVSAASATVSTSSSKPAAAAQPAKSNVQNYDEAENARSDSDDSDDIVRDAAPASLSRDWKDSIAPEQSGLHALVNLRRLQLHAARDFTQAQLHAASENSDLLPVLVVQRQARKAKDYWNEGKLLGYDTVDVPHYIWIQKGTSVTPELVMDKIIASIRQSFDSDKRRESFDREIMDKFSDQRLICFGSSMYLDRTAVPFSAENPLLIDEPSVVCIDWDLSGNDITDMINSLMKPKFIYRAADEPPTSLENMLQAYIEEERLTGANQWRCPHCKKEVEATKQMHIWRASDILIVHLKRFGVSEGFRSRLNAFVDVPLGEVDFAPYFAPDSPFRDQNNRYRLYAVSNHTGGQTCGHYYAYCRPNDGEQWVEFNDSVVREDVDPVITKATYVLFFRRVSDAPRTLESLRASDDRCREGSSSMQELLSSLAVSQGADDVADRIGGHAIAEPAVTRVSFKPVNQYVSDASSDSDRADAGSPPRDAMFYNC